LTEDEEEEKKKKKLITQNTAAFMLTWEMESSKQGIILGITIVIL